MGKEFVDAQQMHKNNPATFDAPDKAGLESLNVGNAVKVCTCGERFWVQISKVEGDKVTGYIDNDLVLTHIHGLKDKDEITFEKRHIYNIL